MAEEEADGEACPGLLSLEFAGDGFQRGFLVFLQLGQLIGVQGDFPFQRRSGNAGDILTDPVAEFSGANRAATFSRVSMASFFAATAAEPHSGSRATFAASSASS